MATIELDSNVPPGGRSFTMRALVLTVQDPCPEQELGHAADARARTVEAIRVKE